MKPNEQNLKRICVVAAFVLSGATSVSAQAPAPKPTPTPEPFFGDVFVTKDGKTARRGESCRPPWPGKGIVKVDACGRWYCGLENVKDLIQARPNLTAEEKCTWTLKDEICRCVK
jgi:hypothetical protein